MKRNARIHFVRDYLSITWYPKQCLEFSWQVINFSSLALQKKPHLSPLGVSQTCLHSTSSTVCWSLSKVTLKGGILGVKEQMTLWCLYLWAAVHSAMCRLSKDKNNTRQQGDKPAAFWLDKYSLGCLSVVYFLRAHQRHLDTLRCKDPVSLLLFFPAWRSGI